MAHHTASHLLAHHIKVDLRNINIASKLKYDLLDTGYTYNKIYRQDNLFGRNIIRQIKQQL